MKIRLGLFLWLCLSSILLFPQIGRAAVVVLANRTDKEVRFTINGVDGKAKDYILEAGALVPIPAPAVLKIDILTGDKRRHYQLERDTAPFITMSTTGLDLRQIGLGEPRPDEAKAK